MNTISFTATSSTIDEMKQHYKQYEINAPTHSQFAAKTPTCRLTIYNSKKVVFQGTGAEHEASLWEKEGVATLATPQLPAHFPDLAVMGSDEVGNGSYFGPLVVVAAYVPKSLHPLLMRYNVRDSKLMTDNEMMTIYKKLKDSVMYQALMLTPPKYNELQPKYNAVRMKVMLHNQALYLLEQRLYKQNITPDAILVDAFTTDKNYKSYVSHEPHQPKTPFYMVTKGEQHHLAVALASIFARAIFLKELQRESNEVGITLPIGANQNVDKIASQIIQTHGMAALEKVSKQHFANTKKAIALAKKST